MSTFWQLFVYMWEDKDPICGRACPGCFTSIMRPPIKANWFSLVCEGTLCKIQHYCIVLENFLYKLNLAHCNLLFLTVKSELKGWESDGGAVEKKINVVSQQANQSRILALFSTMENCFVLKDKESKLKARNFTAEAPWVCVCHFNQWVLVNRMVYAWWM